MVSGRHGFSGAGGNVSYSFPYHHLGVPYRPDGSVEMTALAGMPGEEISIFCYHDILFFIFPQSGNKTLKKLYCKFLEMAIVFFIIH